MIVDINLYVLKEPVTLQLVVCSFNLMSQSVIIDEIWFFSFSFVLDNKLCTSLVHFCSIKEPV